MFRTVFSAANWGDSIDDRRQTERSRWSECLIVEGRGHYVQSEGRQSPCRGAGTRLPGPGSFRECPSGGAHAEGSHDSPGGSGGA